MKPDWDKLMKKYEGHDTILIGDVDCTAEGKPLCDANGVRGYPTIKHGDPAALEKYEGGRDLKSLKKFAKNLKPLCSPAKLDLCDDDQKAKIEEIMAMSDEDLASAIEEKEQLLEDAEETFKSEVAKLQAKYESLQKEKEEALAEVTDSGLGLLKSVAAHKKRAGSAEAKGHDEL